MRETIKCLTKNEWYTYSYAYEQIQLLPYDVLKAQHQLCPKAKPMLWLWTTNTLFVWKPSPMITPAAGDWLFVFVEHVWELVLCAALNINNHSPFISFTKQSSFAFSLLYLWFMIYHLLWSIIFHLLFVAIWFLNK